MISAFFNCFKIPELRDRIFTTLVMLFIARVGANIPLPGVNPLPMQDFFAAQAGGNSGNMLGLYNMFTGGALLKGSIFALGIMPYISASIIMQLLGAVIPNLARLQQEGETGRQKVTQYTRYMTLGICLVQGFLLLMTLLNPQRLFTGFNPEIYGSIVIASPQIFLVTSVLFLTTGTMLMMWLGEQITQRGIGNGISLLITIGILSSVPEAIQMAFRLFNAPVGAESQLNAMQGILMILLLLAAVGGIVMITQGQRKIPVQYAKRVVGRKVYGGQSSFLPLKVNYSGVMPVIFASAILMFIQTAFSWLGAGLDMKFFVEIGDSFLRGHWSYYMIFGFLILIFSYFWVSMMFKPIQIADDLKKYGGYVPGVRPGAPTASFLDFTMTRLTFAGALCLLTVALFPDLLLNSFNIPYAIAQFFGGTGMLIVVGVLLDLLKQIETFLLQRHYDGFLRKGRGKGRSNPQTQVAIDAEGIRKTRKIWIFVAALFVSGYFAWGINVWVYMN
jgi:preprotein translocase subunit SecY